MGRAAMTGSRLHRAQRIPNAATSWAAANPSPADNKIVARQRKRGTESPKCHAGSGNETRGALKTHTFTQRAHRALKAHTSTPRAHKALRAHTFTQRAHRALRAHTFTQKAHRALRAHTFTQKAHRALKAHTSTPSSRCGHPDTLGPRRGAFIAFVAFCAFFFGDSLS
jgi:hypothetical protein